MKKKEASQAKIHSATPTSGEAVKAKSGKGKPLKRAIPTDLATTDLGDYTHLRLR